MLLTRSPLDPKIPFDLHVLGTPPAFILSQDQTLQICYQPKLTDLGSFELGAHSKKFLVVLTTFIVEPWSVPADGKQTFIALHDKNFKLPSHFGQK